MKKILAFFLVLTMLLSLSVTALADGDDTENPAGAIITLDKSQVYLNQTSASALVATVTGVSSDNYVIEWSIDNQDIIVMTPSTDAHRTQVAIRIKGGADGEGIITASIGEVKATCPVKVELPNYVITFDSVGGTEVEAQNVKHRGYVAEPNPPSRTGYTFNGWYKHETKRTNMYKWKFDSNYVEKNLILYADWTINKYTVTFDKGNGTDNESAVYDYNTAAESITRPTDPTKEGYTFVGWEPEIATVTEDVTYTAKWTPKVSVGDATYDTLNDALAQVTDKTDIIVPAEVTLDDAGELTVPANSTITVAESANDNSGEAAASVKELTIAKPDSTSETAYLVTVGGVTSAVKGNAVDNVITGKDKDGIPITTAEQAKAHVAQMFNVPAVLARIASETKTAVDDVDFSMVVTQEGVTQRAGHDKTFEVHPVAKVGGNTYPVTATGELKAKEYDVTLDFGAANAGKYVKLTHYKSDGGSEDLGTPLIGANGKVTCQMTSFSDVSGTIQPDEYGATFTMTVDAPDSISVDTEFEVEVKLTSSVATNLNTMTFSYSLPEKFTETVKTGSLENAVKQGDGTWIWQATSGGANIALPKDTAVSLGTIKMKVNQVDAEYNVDKTITFTTKKLTFSAGGYNEYTANVATDTTKVMTTYRITWDYNGGTLDGAESKTDTFGVNVDPTAPVPVKPGYKLSWNPTVAKATANATYKAVWTLDTTGMSVAFNDYGYAYMTSNTDYDKMLVLNAPALADGFAYAIEGKPMFATTNANYRALIDGGANETVYVYIVNGDETQTTILGDGAIGGATKLSVVEGSNAVLAYDGDLNRDGNAKQGDLGVLVDLFNGRAIYGRTGVVDIRARLEADMDNTANAEALFKSIADINEMIKKLFPASGG